MHRELAIRYQHYAADHDELEQEMRPDDVHITPDGQIATIVNAAGFHGCAWSDMRYLGEYSWPSRWRSVPADQVPVLDA